MQVDGMFYGNSWWRRSFMTQLETWQLHLQGLKEKFLQVGDKLGTGSSWDSPTVLK
jgi:hypothetical protein